MIIGRKIKLIIKLILRKTLFIQRQLYCNKIWLGNGYGGFYVCPDKLSEESVVYSFGIGEDISFDSALIDRFGCVVHGFDPTPKSVAWMADQLKPELFKFFEFGIGPEDGLVDFYLPVNENYVSGSFLPHLNVNTKQKVSVPMKSFKSICASLGHKKIDVLKLDIEGSEYDIIDDILESGINVNQILIEFHCRFFTDGKERTKSAIEKLNEYNYGVFAVSDSFEEVSFIKVQ